MFKKWNKITKCYNCKSTKEKEINYQHLCGAGSVLLEFEVVCAECGSHLNHWAYGSYESATTKTGTIKQIWCQGMPIGVKGKWKALKFTLKILFL